MNLNKLLHNVMIAFSAQGVSLFVGAASTLIVPRVLGVDGYGYWQLFIFYSSYCGFFHLGLNDGVYLLNGGKGRAEIDCPSVTSQLIIGMVFQVVIALVIAAVGALGPWERERSFVLVATAINLVIVNASGYLGYLFQSMNETKIYSFSCMIDRLTFVLPMLGMVVLRIGDYHPYVIIYLLSKLLAFIYSLWHARDILTRGHLGPRAALVETFRSLRVGISLMIANVADMLVLGVARALIDAVWGIQAFGRVSLALSLVNFFISFVTQASMVLFPALRMCSRMELKSVFVRMRSAMEIAFPAAYLFYLPLSVLLSTWLPQYASSTLYIALLLPLCLFNTKMNLCGTTYLKVLRQERILLVLNIATVILSTASTTLCVLSLGSLEAALMGISVSVLLRSVAAEFWVGRELGAPWSMLYIGEVALSAVFVVSAVFVDGIAGFSIYFAAYLVFLTANRREVIRVLDGFRHVISRTIGHRD